MTFIPKNKKYTQETIEKVILLYKQTGSCVQVQKLFTDFKLQPYDVYLILQNNGVEINQSKKKILKEQNRNKICKNCNKKYYDNTKRFVGFTCSKICASELMVKKRKETGSYIVSAEHAQKIKDKVLYSYNTDPEELVKNGIGLHFYKYKNDENYRNEINERTKKTNIKKYGADYFNQTNEYKEKVKKTSLEKYGVDHFTQNELVKNKVKETNIKIYGYPVATQNKEVNKKIQKTRLENGQTQTFDGKTMKEWASLLGVSYSYFKQVKNERGIDAAKNLKANRSDIEQIIYDFLEQNKIEFEYNKYICDNQYRPDFILKKYNLILECDGLYYHNDSFKKDKKYHFKKKNVLKQNGYDALFFRADELYDNFDIVKSIINNKLNLNEKIGARKCSIQRIDDAKEFLEKNHLMGDGAGRYYVLKHQDEIVACIQVKWKNKNNKELEISRFCNRNNTTIQGGFTKLLAFVEKEEKPYKIITFIDKRYGSGEYLKSINFNECGTYLSFRWTDCEKTYGRMMYPKNTGYDNGLSKIWDCGQTKWEKIIKKV